MLAPPLSPDYHDQVLVQDSPHNICPEKQLTDLERITRWERGYTLLLEKAREVNDFRAFSSASSAKPPQHYLSIATQYRAEIDNLYRIYFCDWAPAGTTQPPEQYSDGPFSAQIAVLTVKLMALCPLPRTPDATLKARRDLQQSQLRLMAKQAELIDLDADTRREQSIDPETFLRKYNI